VEKGKLKKRKLPADGTDINRFLFSFFANIIYYEVANLSKNKNYLATAKMKSA
jgi:hypothetical protein